MTAHKRRWLRFSLRALFVVVIAGCCWLGYQLNWIRQRHEVLSRPEVNSSIFDPVGTRAPVGLMLLGEQGHYMLGVMLPFDEERSRELSKYGPSVDLDYDAFLTADERDEIERIRNLFPEADVSFGYSRTPGAPAIRSVGYLTLSQAVAAHTISVHTTSPPSAFIHARRTAILRL